MARSLALALLLTTVCTVAPASAQPSGVRAEIEAANKEFMSAFKKADPKAVAALYTADAQLLPPGAKTLQGPQAIAGYWSGAFASGAAEVVLTTKEVQAAGSDLAYEIGTYTIESKEDKPLDQGKYLVIWKRDQGKWKLHRDIWNSDAAPGSAQ